MQAQSTTYGRVTDPVCGMTIDPAFAAGTSQLEGKPYFFCSASCKGKFDADPTRFGAKPPESSSRGHSGHSCCGR
jgi:P-type Cu+ transporter